ncbi:chemotaxis protein CheX [Botrimarina sp.]|uniref:chemotaxis protein CheX n=1 Tax=Botrimarina sp. TaxID=2795802 RepID=UPI0032EB349D
MANSAIIDETPTDGLLIDFNRTLCAAVLESTPKALLMCGAKGTCVGVSRRPSRQESEITGLIGLHGQVSGFAALGMSASLALHLVDGLLGEPYDKINPQVVDGVGEVANILVGGVKSALSSTDWAFAQITVPSVIVGDGYHVAFARGIELLDVVFEVDNHNAIIATDRLLHVTLSLLKL